MPEGEISYPKLKYFLLNCRNEIASAYIHKINFTLKTEKIMNK